MALICLGISNCPAIYGEIVEKKKDEHEYIFKK